MKRLVFIHHGSLKFHNGVGLVIHGSDLRYQATGLVRGFAGKNFLSGCDGTCALHHISAPL